MSPISRTFDLKVVLAVLILAVVVDGFRLLQTQDEYPWTSCNSFEATKKNCPLGEACLKLISFEYAWNWAMRCQSREEYIARFDYELNQLKRK